MIFWKYSENPKNSVTWKNCCNYPKIGTLSFYYRLMGPKDADGMAISVVPDQTAPDWHKQCRPRSEFINPQIEISTTHLINIWTFLLLEIKRPKFRCLKSSAWYCHRVTVTHLVVQAGFYSDAVECWIFVRSVTGSILGRVRSKYFFFVCYIWRPT